MNIDRARLAAMLAAAGFSLQEKSGELSDLDSRFGDGDHGVTVNKIALTVMDNANRSDDASLKTFLSDLGNNVMCISGGAAAPLWGTFLGGLALPLEASTTEIDADLLKKMFDSALEEMHGITQAGPGGKTMMDAFIPAVAGAQSADHDVGEILRVAAEAARAGAEATHHMAASFGRAKNYGERSIGTPDPGAVGVAFFFEGLLRGWVEAQ